MLPLNDDLSRELDRQLQSDASLVWLAFRARKKLGLRRVADLARAVGVSRQFVYRTLTSNEIEEIRR